MSCVDAKLGAAKAKLEDLGAILSGLGSQVGSLEANLGASWSQLGRFRCQLGGLGGNFTRFGGFDKNLEKPFGFYCFFEHRRVKLEAFGRQVGFKLAVLKHLGGILKASWLQIGGSAKHLGSKFVILAASWGVGKPTQSQERK